MRGFGVCVLFNLVFASYAAAQGAPAAFPSKPIRIIVPFSPGGPADMIARPIAQGLTESWGHQIIVDHRAGAGGILAAELLAKSAPDGYTLMITTPGIVAVNPGLHARLPYDTLEDFAGVTNAVTSSNIMIVHPSLPVASVTDVIRLARTRPGQIGEIRRILDRPEMKPRLEAQGMEPAGNTPEEFDAHIRSELTKWTKVVKQAGIKAD